MVTQPWKLKALESSETEDLYSSGGPDESQVRQQLLRATMMIQGPLTEVNLVGKLTLPAMQGVPDVTCAVLSNSPTITGEASPCLLVPLERQSQLSLLECVVQAEPLDFLKLYVYNWLFVGRDGGIYDNVPWATWTIDPDERYRDAANNDIDPKFHMGKRDAYNRFMGKDLMGKSQVIQRLEQQKIRAKKKAKRQEQDSLQRRILEIEIRELDMDIAEIDYQLAVFRENASKMQVLNAKKETKLIEVEDARLRLAKIDSSVEDVIESWIAKLFPDDKPKAPYPGATGYAPATVEGVSEAQLYRSPFDLLIEILQNQLNAEVIGTTLENTSLLDGTLTLGGAVVLRRITPAKTMTVAGEKLSIADESQEYGNRGIKGGEVFVVECDADEAISLSIAAGIPLQVEDILFETGCVMAERVKPEARFELATFNASDPELSVLVEGQAGNTSTTERTAPIRLSRSSLSLFDALFQPQSDATTRDMFPTDNPVTSIEQFDGFSNEDKARTLMSMSNFEGELPRPRAVKISEQNGGRNALDELLLPLIDESARRQYKIREAEENGDLELAEVLRNEKSRRQLAKEQAELSRLKDDTETAEAWETEAEFLASLRADVTQDEGTYSRFLDKDDWYERDRQRTAKRVDKSKFGTLLDGIE